MPSEIEAIYQRSIRSLPPTERLQLATLILNDLVQRDRDVVDRSDTWTEDDLRDIISNPDLVVWKPETANCFHPQDFSDRGNQLSMCGFDITNFSLQCAEERYPQYGSDKGKVWMSDDFDEPLEDFREYMA